MSGGKFVNNIQKPTFVLFDEYLNKKSWLTLTTRTAISSLALFVVDLEPETNSSDVYDLQNIRYNQINVKPSRKCHNSKIAKLFTAHKHYLNTPKRVRCSKGHASRNSPESKKSKTKCAYCGEGKPP